VVFGHVDVPPGIDQSRLYPYRTSGSQQVLFW
jgi:hypothetical protein